MSDVAFNEQRRERFLKCHWLVILFYFQRSMGFFFFVCKLHLYHFPLLLVSEIWQPFSLLHLFFPLTNALCIFWPLRHSFSCKRKCKLLELFEDTKLKSI